MSWSKYDNWVSVTFRAIAAVIVVLGFIAMFYALAVDVAGALSKRDPWARDWLVCVVSL